MNWTAFIWLGLMVLFLLVEAGTVALVSVWFAAGALAALLVCLLGGGSGLQITLFLAVSCFLLALLRPFVRKYLNPKITPTNVDSLIGKTGLVTEEIHNSAFTGQVKLGAMTWTARSATGETIPVGTEIRVERIEGVKLLVVPAAVTAVV